LELYKLTVMKRDEAVEGEKELSDLLLFIKAWGL
jgi:hypothetical protein